jgi:hypothetical protein
MMRMMQAPWFELASSRPGLRTPRVADDDPERRELQLEARAQISGAARGGRPLLKSDQRGAGGVRNRGPCRRRASAVGPVRRLTARLSARRTSGGSSSSSVSTATG